MKYFAKYIPVEEDMKKGDKYYQKSDPGRKIYEYIPSSHILDMNDFQPVKLFLCSKDIQPTDEVVQVSTGRRFKMGFGGTGEGFVKIIGEISPEATITEGQEFTQMEVDNLKLNNWLT